MCLGIDKFFKNKYRGIEPLSQHFEKEIYQYVNITWLLLIGKHVCESVFLTLSIVKFLRAPVLKNICKRLLLKICSWNWETLKFIHKSFNLIQVFSASASETSSSMVFHDWFPKKFLFTCNISLKKRRQNFKKRICHVNVL